MCYEDRRGVSEQLELPLSLEDELEKPLSPEDEQDKSLLTVKAEIPRKVAEVAEPPQG